MSSVVRLSRRQRELLHSPKQAPAWLKAMARKSREQKQRWFVDGTPFPVGQKKVFLPKFTVALLNTPRLGPKWARFAVPLWFNKMDIRDYLFHAYGVRIFSARSFIHQTKPSVDPQTRRIVQAKSSKHMTVELERPFVWPRKPADMTPWEKEKYDKILRQQLDDSSKTERAAALSFSRHGKGLMRHMGPRRPDRFAAKVGRTDDAAWGAHQGRMIAQAQDILTGKVRYGQPPPGEGPAQTGGGQEARQR